jgi:hypothetical protein
MQEAVTATTSLEINAVLPLLVLIFAQPHRWLERSEPRHIVIHDVLDWLEEECGPDVRRKAIEMAKRIALSGMEA